MAYDDIDKIAAEMTENISLDSARTFEFPRNERSWEPPIPIAPILNRKGQRASSVTLIEHNFQPPVQQPEPAKPVEPKPVEPEVKPVEFGKNPTRRLEI